MNCITSARFTGFSNRTLHDVVFREMVDVLGGDEEDEIYRWFQELCIRGFLAVRAFHEEIILLVSMMRHTEMPCFRGNMMKNLKDRFKVDLPERAAAEHIKRVMDGSYLSWRSIIYDFIQSKQNKIWYSRFSF